MRITHKQLMGCEQKTDRERVMKKANTDVIDAAITEAVNRRAALAKDMAISSDEAKRRIPEMTAICAEINELQVKRSNIIRETFCR